MSENWYCQIFGAELGPMSWDDLVQTMVQGALRPQDQVRRENDDWRAASTVAGLLDAAAAARPATVPTRDDPASMSWYCEILGAELGPMRWNDLQDMARRGALKSNNRVRSERNGEWVEAGSVSGLNWGTQSLSDDDTGFEVDAALRRSDADEDSDFEISVPSAAVIASDTDFEVSAATPIAAADDTDFDVVGGAHTGRNAASSLLAAADNAPLNAVAVESQETAHVSTSSAPAETPPESQPVPEASKIGESAAVTPAPKEPEQKKPEKKKPPKRAPRERASFELTAGHKKALVGVVGACCLAGLGYLAYGALGSRSSANYDAILADYQKLYDEAQSAHQNRAAGITPDVQKRFVDTLANIRKPLEGAEPGTMDDRLFQAGNYLVEMLAGASAPPQSSGEVKYINAEKSYNDLVTSVRGELGK